MSINAILENAFYLLALLNPASKMMFLASYEPALSRRQTQELAWKSSLAALLILFLLAAAGNFVLFRIFRVQLYSLQITGGAVVFMIGWTAIREGRFLSPQTGIPPQSFTDLSLVPLAAPLIAGPGMIAQAVAMSMEHGLFPTLAALTVAIAINFALMLFSSGINRTLNRVHLVGPLIRLTGLIISAISMQMMISGLKNAFC